ncbi:MAG: hypothetical protein GY873_29755 [Bosea sp.]|uniref:hypothetical protein n=1 Tax=Bosea sp. (in: a-proteobacteria) TaxID=1871050 RepID=UPI0023A10C28|nr:hypothetical protein [Bosea sp. (in: a-proteobacteria)]MCP4738380.1 hypothetical protein [Bosea sp. (in: a-proteobacteria)]
MRSLTCRTSGDGDFVSFVLSLKQDDWPDVVALPASILGKLSFESAPVNPFDSAIKVPPEIGDPI